MRNIAFLSVFGILGLHGNPVDPVVSSGKAHFSQPSSDLLEIRTSDKAIIYWSDFSIDAGEHTRFIQPSCSSSVLNRVLSGNPSQIAGRLSANGHIYLVNPNGIVIADSAVINTNRFTAGSFILSDTDFLSPDFQPESLSKTDCSGFISHSGQIIASDLETRDGRVYLIASSVSLDGSIQSPQGDVYIRGDRILLGDRASIDTSGESFGGNISIQANHQISVEKTASILANALVAGNGGFVEVLSDESTYFLGSIQAKGGSAAGDGGWIEVSGKYLDYQGTANTGAPFGRTGSLLLDPINITVLAPNMNVTLPGAPPFIHSPTASPSQIDPATIAINLMTSDVVVESSGAPGAEQGNVIIASVVTNSTPNTLTFRTTGTPNGDILIQADVTASMGGNLIFNASGSILQSGCTVQADSGNISYSAAADVTLGDSLAAADTRVRTTMGGDIVINAADDFFMNCTPIWESRIDSFPGAGGTTTLNIGKNAILTPTITQPCNITSNAGTLLNIGKDFLISPGNTGNGFVTSNTGYWTLNVGGNFFLGGDTSFLENSSGTSFSINIGGNLTMGGNTSINNGGLGSSGILMNVGGNFSIVSTPSDTPYVSSQSGPLIINVGGTLFATGDGTIDASNTSFVSISAGGSIELQEAFEFSFPSNDPAISVHAGENIVFSSSDPSFDTGLTCNSNGPTSLTAGGDIILSGNSYCETSESGSMTLTAGGSIHLLDTSIVQSLMGGNVTLIVDADNPSPPGIGGASFVKASGASIFTPTGAVKIFTARRNQNAVAGNIRGTPFIPGPEFVNSTTEIWGVYFPHNSGFPYTIFYKNINDSTLLSKFNTITSEYPHFLKKFDRYMYKLSQYSIRRKAICETPKSLWKKIFKRTPQPDCPDLEITYPFLLERFWPNQEKWFDFSFEDAP